MTTAATSTRKANPLNGVRHLAAEAGQMPRHD